MGFWKRQQTREVSPCPTIHRDGHFVFSLTAKGPVMLCYGLIGWDRRTVPASQRTVPCAMEEHREPSETTEKVKRKAREQTKRREDMV